MIVNYKIIGRQIRVQRRSQRMSQASLAEQAELSVSYISCIERAKRMRNAFGAEKLRQPPQAIYSEIPVFAEEEIAARIFAP